jgi:RHS repeat-associated protein
LQGTLGYGGLYNGNIAWVVTDLPKLGQLANDRRKGMQGMLYGYDQLNRIVQSRSLTSYNSNSGFAARAGGSTSAYDENYTYDGNGNLLSLQRNNETGALQDDFQYAYHPGSNKLREVKPVTRDKTISSGSVTQDNILYRNLTLQGSSYVSAGKLVEVKAVENIRLSPNFRSAQSTDFWAHLDEGGTYQYDGIGNLILDQDEGIKISWTPYGKVREVRLKGDSLVTKFRYDAMGNRVEKRVLLADTTYALTRYLRDASGNVIAIYKDTTLTEQPLYGSSRLGEYRAGVGVGMRKLGRKNYELSNHLGNVLAVISDKVGMQTDSVWTSVASTSDYYPFGLGMKGRTWSDTTGYKPRYGFNGQEKVDEIAPGHYTAEFWEYNSKIGRRWNIDPITYPWQSTYSCFNNNPIFFIDPLGLQGEDPKKSRTYRRAESYAYKVKGEVSVHDDNSITVGYTDKDGATTIVAFNKTRGDKVFEFYKSIGNWFKDATFTGSLTGKVDFGAQGRLSGTLWGAKANVDLNVAKVNLFTGKLDNKDFWSHEYIGGNKGTLVTNSLGASIEVPVNTPWGNLGVGGMVEQSQRIDGNLGSNDYKTDYGVYAIVPVLQPKSFKQVKDGMTQQGMAAMGAKSPSVSTKEGKQKDFYGVDVGVGVAFLLGVDLNLKVGFKK